MIPKTSGRESSGNALERRRRRQDDLNQHDNLAPVTPGLKSDGAGHQKGRTTAGAHQA